MAQERVTRALERIEKALARIEASAARRTPAQPGADGADFDGLRAAHQALRFKVEGAIADLDRLLETEGAH